jgi:hypothetical protein
MLQRLVSMVALLALAACGGGGGSAGTPPFQPPPTGPTIGAASAADLVLTLSASSIANTGTETVVATAIAIDTNRNTVAGVPVTVQVDSDAVATPKGAVTDAGGVLSAAVGIGSNRTVRTITVTARSGSISKTAALQVQDAGGGNSGIAPSDLLLTLNRATIANNGTQTATATVTALDAKRNVLPGVVVAISADQGATVAPGGTATTSAGVLTASIGIGSNQTNRTITVTATAAGLAPRTVTLQVVDSPTTANPTAAALSLALSSATVSNGGSSTITAIVTAVDSNRNALAGIPVAIRLSDTSAVAQVSSSTTNAQGQVTATIGIGVDRSNRNITVTATSGTVTQSATFAVIGATITASFSPQVTAGSTGNQIEYRLVDANATPMAGLPFAVSAPGLLPGNGTTDGNGKYTYTYTAPAAAGGLTVAATAAGDTKTQQISVQAPGNTVPPAPGVPSSASLTPTPSVVSVNLPGSTANQVELRALFLGANNQPVQNIRVRFSVDPANSSDGTASQLGGSTYAYSDSSGVARGTFTPGQRSSPTNGVTVRACWDTTDFDINATCPSTRLITATLTIVSEALSVNIRTNELIKSGAAQLTYIKEFVVMVVDAAGQAKPDVLITPSIDLPAYYKGFYAWNGRSWAQRVTLATSENWSWNAPGFPNQWSNTTTTQPQCPNEDQNRNGVREAGAFLAGATPPVVALRQEDLNWNGDIDPRKSDVAIKMVGSARTDLNGLAIVQIEYGRNLASWVDFSITVTASGISGTESRAVYRGLLYGVGNLPFPADSITSETAPPAFRFSPYGQGSVNSNTNANTGVCTDTQ